MTTLVYGVLWRSAEHVLHDDIAQLEDEEQVENLVLKHEVLYTLPRRSKRVEKWT